MQAGPIRLFSYLHLRPSLPASNVNSRQYPMKCFSSRENDSDKAYDYDRAVEPQVFVVQNLF